MKSTKPKKLLKKIFIINRETGHTDFVIENQTQYDYYWNWFLKQNDILPNEEIMFILIQIYQNIW